MNSFENPLPGVPYIESPFFDRFFPLDMVEPEVRRIALDLRDKGYAVLDFPDDEIDTIADRIASNFAERCNLSSWRKNPTYGIRIQDAWRTDADVRRLAVNEKILYLLERLYGRVAFPFQSLTFPVGTQQHFHTDSVHFSSQPERFMCGVWVALEDIGTEQGPLLYYPGSHKWPVYTNEHIGYTYSENAAGP